MAEYLDQWLETHAMEIKPGTLEDYRKGVRLYVNPHIGKMKLQAVRPSTITKLYRDLLAKGGRDGKPLSVATVVHTHAILRRAFREAVVVEQLLDSSPVERAKRPRARPEEPGTVWTPAQLRTFLAVARRHRLYASFHVADETVAVLREHRKAQAADKLLADDAWRGENDCHVFTTRFGEPYTPTP